MPRDLVERLGGAERVAALVGLRALSPHELVLALSSASSPSSPVLHALVRCALAPECEAHVVDALLSLEHAHERAESGGALAALAAQTDARGYTALDTALDEQLYAVAEALRVGVRARCARVRDPAPRELDLELPTVAAEAPAGAASSGAGGASATALRVQFASDLHIEFFDDAMARDMDACVTRLLQPVAPLLVLIGDIGVVSETNMRERYRAFLLACARRFRAVLVVAGNHEYYNAHTAADEGGERLLTMSAVEDIITGICAEHASLYFCRRTRVRVNNRARLLVTSELWSEVPERAQRSVERYLNDYRLIGDEHGARITVAHTNKLHGRCVQWLEAEVVAAYNADEPVAVFTHHSPTYQFTSHGQYRTPLHNPTNRGFSTNLEYFFRTYGIAQDGARASASTSSDDDWRRENSTVHVWAYGHTHHNHDAVMHGTRVVANQRGYESRRVANVTGIPYRADMFVLVPC